MTRPHPDWCARGHRCGLGEHRAVPTTFAAPGAGGAVLTRVRDSRGVDHAEIVIRITLPDNESDARTRLAAVLTHVRTLIGPPRIEHVTRPNRTRARLS